MIRYNGVDTFHLYNNKISYLIQILENGQLGQLYFGKKIKDRDDFSHMSLQRGVVLAPCTFEGNLNFSSEVLMQEYPAYGTGDFRDPAYVVEQENGSRITNFVHKKHKIYNGKPKLEGLPHTHGEGIETLEITLEDELINAQLILKYHIFGNLSCVVRSAEFVNNGSGKLIIDRALSCSIDLPDYDYDMITLDGAWSRERHITTRRLSRGVQSVASARGASSAMHNPFLALKRPNTTEQAGDAYGFSLIYSGNFLAQAEVDSYDVTRVMVGINPFEFQWTLNKGECFQTPEAVMVFSDEGLNGMSQGFHDLFRNHLINPKYSNTQRPVLINNWEATYFDFTHESIVEIASGAKELGVELFVLDDGWFGKRNNDTTSLGDWTVNLEKLPEGIEGLSRDIRAMGLKFGLWFEPEMVNEVSELYKTHPDFVIKTPNRNISYGRNQFVLDFSREDVVMHIFDAMCAVLDKAELSYIKWDMNRNITEAYSISLTADRQKEFFHRYILGVYKLYDLLIARYQDIMFESCASGGARFDAGMLYYAPQAWCSDDTDAVERLHIQYGTSMLYPVSSMGSHVAAVPNHQVMRETSLKMRADVAYFGTFGYELNLNRLTDGERDEVREQIAFFKKHQALIHQGDFYRLMSGNHYGWMVVSKDKKQAILGYYKILATPNPSLKRIALTGLCEEYSYSCNGKKYHGDELMNYGFSPEIEFTGLIQSESFKGKLTAGTDMGDFTSQLYVFCAE